MSSHNIYSDFVYLDRLISPINGHTTKRITKSNIRKFGFESTHQLLQVYPGFPLVCAQSKQDITAATKKGRSEQLRMEEAKYMVFPTPCTQCHKPLPYLKRTTKFCNSSCSAKYNNTRRSSASATQRNKTSQSLKCFHADNPEFSKLVHKNCTSPSGINFTKVMFTECTCCGKPFYTRAARSRVKITCSPECARINSTYKKIVIPYDHKGKTVSLESSWELAIAQWLDVMDIDWTRPAHLPWVDTIGKKRKYFADFYLPKYDLYLDPKNPYQISISLDKLNYISSRHKLVYGEVDYIKSYILGLIPNG